ncbi:hypothetical protein BDV38DRAFT_140463 [Aspergillus pseudotamarii]|uniref:Uncharacterized protein n=1 Tax=Aspergillus pseudotamarii TaxID=132259 RepID=A0A5N6SL85_ASPPS|nr:uncharacterized protein BDV38DRAFT_140463 [Aspergillus pseudotamarii]KAE8135305.1 hypothetical protein BDV38DRAFT_140463 [Aspergillus pseudotamarii]
MGRSEKASERPAQKPFVLSTTHQGYLGLDCGVLSHAIDIPNFPYRSALIIYIPPV